MGIVVVCPATKRETVFITEIELSLLDLRLLQQLDRLISVKI